MLSQFRESGDKQTLSDYFKDPSLRVAGRLDYDSEGLLLLSDDGQLVQKISNPRFKLEKTYWVQVEGEPTESDLDRLRAGVTLKDGKTLPAGVELISEPNIWPRDPPVRVRKAIPTRWLDLEIGEGRNRQVRRMTAYIGYPTLRLIRYRVGGWELGDLPVGGLKVLRRTSCIL